MPYKNTKYKKWKKKRKQTISKKMIYGSIGTTGQFWGHVKKLVAQHGAWNSAGLNSCVRKWGPQFIFNTCRILCTVLGNCSQYEKFLCNNPLRMHQTAYVTVVMAISILTKLLLTSFSVFLDYSWKYTIFSP